MIRIFQAGQISSTLGAGRLFLLWAIAVAPGVPYTLLYMGHRKNLLNKRDMLNNLMSEEGVLDSYRARFGQIGDKREKIVAGLFDLYYRAGTYWMAVVLNMVVVTIGMAIGMIRVGISFELPDEIEALAKNAPLTLSMGFAGAYLLGLYDTLRRCRTSDLSAYSLHFTWVHMILASILAPLVGQAFTPAIGAPVAFGLGLLPIKDTVDFARESAKKKLEMNTAAQTPNGPALGLVQGLNKDVIDRLEEEGITSTVELAYYDPIKLFLKTNFQWAWVIDVMDQAILINYVGHKIEVLRPVGIRGAIEMTVLGEPTETGTAAQQRISNVVSIVAKKLGMTADEALNLGDNLYEDGQVDLLWELFKPYGEENKLEQQPRPNPLGGADSSTTPTAEKGRRH